MKKVLVLCCILSGILLIASIFLSVKFIGVSSKMHKNNEKLSKKNDQIESLVSDNKVKNMEIESLYKSNSDKDKEILSKKQQLSKKNIEIKNYKKKLKKYKKQKKDNRPKEIVAEIGNYESEDTTGIVEVPGESPKGTVRTLTVDNSSPESITISIEETTTGGRHIEGIYDINVNLKKGIGYFSKLYEGWSLGDFTFEGQITVMDSKKIKIYCKSNADWGTHVFTKK